MVSSPIWYWTCLTSTEGQKTTISDSTQTDDASRLGLLQISRNSFISDKDCLSAADTRGLLGANENASISDSDSTSDWVDCSFSSTELMAQEGACFKLLAKGRSSKLKMFESKSQTKLFNRSTGQSSKLKNPVKNPRFSCQTVSIAWRMKSARRAPVKAQV